MKIRKGVSLLRLSSVHRIENIWIQEAASNLQMVMVERSAMERIKSKWDESQFNSERPLYACAHPKGIEIWPAADKQRNIVVRYTTLHQA